MSLQIKNVETNPLTVEVKRPPQKPVIERCIIAVCKILNRDEFNALNDEQLKDDIYFDKVVDAVEGLIDEDGKALTGDAAIDYCKNGRYGLYILTAILTVYFEQYSEARQKNSRSQRRS